MLIGIGQNQYEIYCNDCLKGKVLDMSDKTTSYHVKREFLGINSFEEIMKRMIRAHISGVHFEER